MRIVTLAATELGQATAGVDTTIREAMVKMSDAGLRHICVTDDAGRLLALVADGDLRRYFAAGGELEDPLVRAGNPSPTTLSETLSHVALREWMLARNVEAAPQVVDGRLVALHTIRLVDTTSALSAVVMAGGLGSRLAPLTDKCPKPLITVGREPILTHIINHLRAQGVRRFVLPVNYLAGMIMDQYGDGSDLGVQIDYVQETRRMGTGGALSLINPGLLSDPFVVMNGDILNDVDVNGILAHHRTMGLDGTMVVREHHYTIPYGVVRVANNQFVGADEKPTYNYLINAGIYLLSKSVLALVPRDTFYDLPSMFDDMREAGLRGGVFNHGGRWIDIGNLADLERARSIFEGPENERSV